MNCAATPGCTHTHPNHPRCTVLDPETRRYRDVVNPSYVPPKTARGGEKGARSELERIAGTVRADPTTDGFPAGLAASQASAGTWTDEQRTLVRSVLREVCEDNAGGGEFTTEAVWVKLAGRVPVTKGMTALLARAKKDRWLDSTGKTAIAQRGGEHDHGQRLTVWYSLIEKRF